MITPTEAVKTRMTYARVAGFTFLFYIAAGIAGLALTRQTNVTGVLSLFTSLSALVLGVTLYAITHEQGPALALLALTCRIVEAVSGEAAFFFAVGSMLFCWLLLRGRTVPVLLARLGLVASVLLVVILPLQRAGLFGGLMAWSASVTWLIWMPMMVFEVALALWLLIKGVALPHNQQELPASAQRVQPRA